jgi:serine/threonine-protein kinase
MNQQLLNNRYRILKILGAGGFGQTFLAEDSYMPSGRKCAIKQLKPQTNDHQMFKVAQQRFGREAAILEDVGEGSNQIPKLYAYFEEDKQFYLVQEFIEGPTLTKKVEQQGKLSENEVKDILASLLPVLDYVHNKRMIHRDIKPDNVIIRQRDNKPVLIDFGAVKESVGGGVNSPANNASMIIGTPGYMPSEQAAGQPVYSSDLYSLGLTAVFLLTGKSPQELQTDPRTGEILWHQQASRVSPSLVSVLDKAIASHPRDRYSSAGEMLSALQSGAVEPGVAPSGGGGLSNMATVAVSPGGRNPGGSSPQNAPQTVPNQVPAGGPIIGQGQPPWLKAALIAGGLVALALILILPFTRTPRQTASKGTGETRSETPNSPSGTQDPGRSERSPEPDPDRSPTRRDEDTPPPVVPDSPSPSPRRSPVVVVPVPTPSTAPVRSPVVSDSPSPSPVRRSPAVVVPVPTPSTAPERSPSSQPQTSPQPSNPNQNSGSNSGVTFPVGTQRRDVESTLGQPSRDVSGRWRTRAVVYELGQIDLGYLYDRNSGRIRQTEASFRRTVDLPIMTAALDEMIDGGATDSIKEGLQLVQRRRSDSFTFRKGSLQGQIVRQNCGDIYISIWEQDLHDFEPIERSQRC